MPLPSSYQDSALRAVTPLCPQRGYVGLAFDMPDGSVVRIALPAGQARALHADLAAYLALCGCQSSKSSEMPSALGSPHDGQKVAPMAMSSAAAAALWYEPSPSPSNIACQRLLLSSRIQNVPARVLWLKAVNWFMVRALSMGGGWNFHSRKAPRAAIWPELAEGSPATANAEVA